MVDFALNARSRNEMGKGASRRLRRLAGEVPAIIYGGDSAPENIALGHDELNHALGNEAFYSHIIKLSVDSQSQDVILKDVQRHPAKQLILHVDFLRVDKDQKLTTRVPLHFINEESCHGVKMEGGVITHSLNELEIACLPADLPEYIEVDMVQVRLGEIVHISDLKLPSGVESVALAQGEDHDLPVAAVNKTRGTDADGEVGEESAEGAEGQSEES